VLVQPEFGLFWAVLPDHRGRSYAGEAAQAVIDWLFQRLNVRRVVAMTESKNVSSQRVMHKLGFRLLRNQHQEPYWSQVVGVLMGPRLKPMK